MVVGHELVNPYVADCAGSPSRTTARMNHAAADGSMTARKVDWVMPAKDTTVVAGEQHDASGMALVLITLVVWRRQGETPVSFTPCKRA